MHRLAILALFVGAACGGSERPAVQDPDRGAESEGDDAGDMPEHRRSAVPDVGDEDDGMEVRGLRGRLDQYDIQKGLKPHLGEIAQCHKSKTRRRRYVGGRLTLKYVVGKSGAVKQVQIIESDLGAWDVELCVLEIARAMRFARPKGEADADFTVPVDFPARGNVQWWEEERADEEVKEKLADLEECEDPPADVWVTLYVGTRGEVKSVGYASPDTTPISDEWAECATDMIRSWVLSDPRGRVAKTGFRYSPE
jgi:TonB family protein